MPLPVDWGDPCARAVALRDAYYRLVSGGGEIEIMTRTDDAEERVKFAAGSDLGRLKAEWETAAAECQALTTGEPARPRRFAIRGGSFSDGGVR